VEAFAARLRDELDLDALSTELLGVVDQTVQPTRSSLWLRPSAQESRRTGFLNESALWPPLYESIQVPPTLLVLGLLAALSRVVLSSPGLVRDAEGRGHSDAVVGCIV
jgi:hypothetical protein